MSAPTRGIMLLLDLDGVVVLEVGPRDSEVREILLLHEGLGALLEDLALPVVILTHRSRAEARLILQIAGLAEIPAITGIVAAEDILIAALRAGRPWGLLRQGLLKSWSLPVVERRFGIQRSSIAFVDDRADNLVDMLANGVGLALHAPSVIAADGSVLTSFDFAEVQSALVRWNGGPPVAQIFPIPPRSLHRTAWRRTGVDSRRQARHVFNAARSCARIARKILLRK